MFTIVVVDDEPAAIHYMRQLVGLVREDFSIIGEYTDGKCCLDELDEKHPDVVISDIRMPGISGLELTKEVNRRYPNIVCLILSGYSEFEYAREAIKGRVYEYLLKPILPDDFVTVMNRIRMAILSRYLRERDGLIRDMRLDREVEYERLKRYFGTEQYMGILMRKNGLLGENMPDGEIGISSELYEQIMSYGCDDREMLCLIPAACMGKAELLSMGKKLRMGLDTKGDCFTVILTETSFGVEEMPEIIHNLYYKLYKVMVPEKEAVYFLERETKTAELDKDDKLEIERIRELLVEDKRGEAYLEFEKLCEEFAKKEIPEKIIRHTVHYILQTHWVFSEKPIDVDEQKKLLENLLYESRTVAEMCENVKILFSIKEKVVKSGKIDTEENYFKILDYIRTHLKETLSLNGLAQKFGISTAYLTKMFRKYGGMSYNQFLIHERMEEAKKLLMLHPDWFIKDIALLVGYSDQFYFSRVFRSYTGKCPSDYIADTEEENESR